MSALARLRAVADQLALDEQDDAYFEAIREYRSNIRESWLRQEIARIHKRLGQIHNMKIFNQEYGWSMAVLKRYSWKESSALQQHRKELERLRRYA